MAEADFYSFCLMVFNGKSRHLTITFNVVTVTELNLNQQRQLYQLNSVTVVQCVILSALFLVH